MTWSAVFVNTLVLRTDLSGDPTFTGLLARVRDMGLAALDHQDVPFEKLVDELAPARSPGPPSAVPGDAHRCRTPSGLVPDLPGVRVEAHDGGVAGGQVRPGGQRSARSFDEAGEPAGIRGALVAAADLFDEQTAVVIAERFVRVLEVLADDPGTRLSGVDVMGADERRRVVQEWNDTAAVVPAETVAGLFAARVAAVPDAAAVVFGDAVVSYRELDGRAGRLAGFLAAAGVGPESVVGLCLPRGVQMLTAVLAVWKAGAAYLPVDPELPAERAGFMLADSRAVLVHRDR